MDLEGTYKTATGTITLVWWDTMEYDSLTTPNLVEVYQGTDNELYSEDEVRDYLMREKWIKLKYIWI